MFAKAVQLPLKDLHKEVKSYHIVDIIRASWIRPH